MGGIFGSASRGDAVPDVFYGTDYHSHLGTRRGGMVVRGEAGFKRNIHDITNAPVPHQVRGGPAEAPRPPRRSA